MKQLLMWLGKQQHTKGLEKQTNKATRVACLCCAHLDVAGFSGVKLMLVPAAAVAAASS
jgi:hypothetical protein